MALPSSTINISNTLLLSLAHRQQQKALKYHTITVTLFVVSPLYHITVRISVTWEQFRAVEVVQRKLTLATATQRSYLETKVYTWRDQ